VRGLRGTLNHDDVVQTMDAQHGALFGCIEQGRRSARWVAGSIRFAFKVDPEGQPTDVRAVESDIGHHELEGCLTGVLSGTRFPQPAGRMLTRDFFWGMSVEPAYREAEPMDAAELKKLLKKQSREVYKSCQLARRRNRYAVTAYVSPRGKITSLGAVATRGKAKARAKLDCVLEQVASWKLPRVKRRSKVRFELR